MRGTALSWIVGALVLLCGVRYDSVSAVTIDFDTLSSGVQPGNVLAGSGVIFTTGDIPDVIAVGGVITLTNIVNEFQIVSRANAPSTPNLAVARDAGKTDLLMSFAIPVTSVSLTTDNSTEESSDLVRLLALASTSNPNEFTVLAFDEALDDAVNSPINFLSVNAGGSAFSFALFQLTTEREGFDDLTFAPIPELSSLLLLASGLAGLAAWRRKNAA